MTIRMNQIRKGEKNVESMQKGAETEVRRRPEKIESSKSRAQRGGGVQTR